MKHYPSIPHINRIFKKHKGQSCWAFHKYDGSNLRFEWSVARGFYKYGTRNRLFDETDDVFGDAVPLFNETVAPTLGPILHQHYSNRGRAIVYCEYFGPNSFAGSHLPSDPKTLVLFDVSVHKVGFVPPTEFLTRFGSLPYTAMIHFGRAIFLDRETISEIQQDPADDYEGIVFKGGKTTNKIWRGKVKTSGWLTKLKQTYKNGWEALQ